ncbi:MAG: tetratricopeptide repeat protein, partial [Gemmatimonadota bacterium]
LIMPEDVTPPEEMKRPSSKLVQMVSPQVPAEEAPQRGEGGAQPMLTETMGDLYLKQGFKSEAADVYRRLLAQRPDDATLRAKLAQVEGPPPSLSAAALGSEAVGAWLRRVAGSSLSAPPPPAAPLAEDQPPMETAFAAPEPEPNASFDEFFGAAPEKESVRPKPAEAAPPAEDDVSSFDSWLHGLKR